MRWLVYLARCCALAASFWLPCTVNAQSFPNKPIRFILRVPPGGADDVIARIAAPAITKVAGQPVVIDYRPGAGGLVAWEFISKQPPDGHTVLLAASGLAAIKSLRADVALDPFRDITWVSQVRKFHLVLSVHPALPVRNLRDLIALARSRPGQLNYGTSGVGTTAHLAAEYFKAMAKVQINHVPYKGAGAVFVDQMSGRIEVGSSVMAGALVHIRSGRIRPLGVSGAQRSNQLPEVPTVAEGGLTGYAFEPFYALVAAAGTPREIANMLAEIVSKALTPADFRAQFLNVAGSEVAVNTPEQMLQTARKEADLIERIVRTAGIKPESN